MTIFDNPSDFICASTTVKEKIARLQLINTTLEEMALKAAGSSDIANYSINSGQSQVNIAYRSPQGLADAITSYETLLQRLINQVSRERVVRLMPAQGGNR